MHSKLVIRCPGVKCTWRNNLSTIAKNSNKNNRANGNQQLKNYLWPKKNIFTYKQASNTQLFLRVHVNMYARTAFMFQITIEIFFDCKAWPLIERWVDLHIKILIGNWVGHIQIQMFSADIFLCFLFFSFNWLPFF